MGEIPEAVLERAAQALTRYMAGDERGWPYMVGEATAVLEAAGYVEMVEALKEAEACMSLVSPLGYKYEYLRVLSHIRSALAKASPSPVTLTENER